MTELSSRGIIALPFFAGGFETEDGFAFLHQVEAVAGDCFQISRIILEQAHFALLPREQ